MILSLVVAVLAAVSTAQCQEEVTEIVTRCTTSYSEFAVPTGSTIRTGYFTTTYTHNFSITSTTQATITVTPAATTFTDVVSVTSTTTTTVISTPPAVTISAHSRFFPIVNTGILVAPTPTPAAIGRHRRASLESRAQHLERVKRLPKTPSGNTSGFIMLPNGQGQSLTRGFPAFVECRVSININSTTTTIVTALPATEVLVPATATAVSTSTFYTTETILETAAQPTEYAACQPNNVVNNVIGFANAPIYFDRIVFANDEGFPVANSLVVNTTSPVNCCIACHNTPFCAGSFYAPSISACHLQLTQAAPNATIPTLPSATLLPPFPLPSSNTSLPYPAASGAPYPAGNDTAAFLTGTAALATAYSTLIPIATPISSSEEGSMSILPIVESPSTGTFAQPGAGTCPAGSLTLYLGRAYGQSSFPPELALYFSNGPCGRMSIGFDEAAPVRQEDLTPLAERRWIGSSLL